MIGLRSSRLATVKKALKLKGFDDFEVRLGDIMRGERATRGKSLMDVQRELKIKAAYIAAVEDADPSVFDTPGFIAGYVRSYAKYLGMDAEESFDLFCKESGFKPIHGMSDKALPNRLSREQRLAASAARPSSGLGASTTPFLPPRESFFNRVDIRAIFSSLVLVFLLGGLGYGAYTVVQKIQRVQMVPVEQPPLVASDLDPLRPRVSTDLSSGQVSLSSDEIYSRIYRPQALDRPVLVPRDGAISNLNPNEQGAFAFPIPAQVAAMDTTTNDTLQSVLGAVVTPAAPPALQLVEPLPDPVRLVAEQGVWLRVKDADGSIIFEQIMDAKNPFDVPFSDRPAVIERAGNSGALFFLVNGELYGPAGNGARTAKNIELSPENLTQTYDLYKPDQQSSFYSFLLDLEAEGARQ